MSPEDDVISRLTERIGTHDVAWSGTPWHFQYSGNCGCCTLLANNDNSLVAGFAAKYLFKCLAYLLHVTDNMKVIARN